MESVRRFVRALIGRTPLYGWLSRATEWIAVVRTNGFRTWSTLSRLRRRRGDVTALRLRNLDHPLLVRPHPDDVITVINTIVREEWGRLGSDAAPRTMIDAGAYIGDTAAYFLSRFPALSVIALEPERENYALAAKNLAPYGSRAQLLEAGLWSADGQLGMAASFTNAVIDRAGSDVSVVSMPTLLARFGIEQLDILKMDIEGAESEVLSSGADAWLPRVRMVILEIHGEAMTVVRPVLERNGFSMRRFRSVWYCER